MRKLILYIIFFVSLTRLAWAQCPSDCNNALFNTFVGNNVGTSNTTGSGNAFFGLGAGASNTTGSGNAFFGLGAGFDNTTGGSNSFFGRDAGFSNTTGLFNSFFGGDAGANNTTGIANSFFGTFAGLRNTTGISNSFFGISAGRDNTTGSFNAFFGLEAGVFNTTGANNSFFGRSAGQSNTTGDNNAFFGSYAGQNNTTGQFNAFFGPYAGQSNTTGQFNAFFGPYAGSSNTTGFDNAFFGRDAGSSNTLGSGNAFFGQGAGQNNTTGSGNVFLGSWAGFNETTSNKLYIANDSTSHPLIYGDFAQKLLRIHGSLDVTEGISPNSIEGLGIDGSNTFLGTDAGLSNNFGNLNTFIGANAGRNNDVGDANTFLGSSSGENNTEGDLNTFLGHLAGFSNTTGGGNTFLGNQSGQSNTTGNNNLFLGGSAGNANTTGNNNTFVGNGAGLSNVNGSGNVFLGNFAGFNETGSNKLYIDNSNTASPLVYGDFNSNVVAVNGRLGVGIQNPERPIHLRATDAIFRIDRDRDDPGFAIVRYNTNFNAVWKSFYFYTRATGLNTGKFVIADWQTSVSGPSTARLVIANNGNIGIGDYLFTDPSQKLTVQGNALASAYLVTSDKRFKKDIQSIPQAMDRLNQLKGVSYSYETQKFAERGLPQGQNLGLIAQEVEKVFPELVVEDAEGYKAVNYDGLIPVLIEALKEQKLEINSLKEELKTLKNQHQPSDIVHKEAILYQNQPNPFDRSTVIRYYLPESTSSAAIIITDLQGKEVSRQVLSQRGEGNITLQAGSLGNGLYLYTLVVNGELMDTKRMLIEQ